MDDAPQRVPVRYRADLESPEPGEAETRRGLEEAMRGILATTHANLGYPVRSVHAKSHGLLRGTFRVMPGLAPELAQGLFARPGDHACVLRLSTNPGDLLDDSVSVPRGAALKVVGVEGERLEEAPEPASQDFLMVDAPAFLAPDAASFLSSLRLLAATTDSPQAPKKALSAVLRGAEAALEAVGLRSARLVALGGHPNTHLLGETFHTATAFRHGEHVAKYSLAPATPELRALEGERVRVSGRPEALREEVVAHFATRGGAWEFRAQLLTDPEAMPVEDASVAWPEALSPHRVVARLEVPPQTAWDEERSRAVDLGMAFSPWNGLAAHRPLGRINRARRGAYDLSAEFRALRSGCPMHRPAAAAELPI